MAIAKSMNALLNHINELQASEAFTRQSVVFDQLYESDAIIRYKRKRVRNHILKHAKERGCMLELNCGTGEDAIFFAQKGFAVHATDISTGMLEVFNKKISGSFYRDRITTEQCSFTDLDHLQRHERFDHIYSNFGGLNCTAELGRVLESFDKLVKPGGIVTLVIISEFCLWETLLLFKGKFRTAFRRYFSWKGRRAQVEGKRFKCWYYSPSFVKKCLRENFDCIALEGLCSIVPPSYLERFAQKYPRLFRFLVRKENQLNASWPWNRIGDYFIVSFRKK